MKERIGKSWEKPGKNARKVIRTKNFCIAFAGIMIAILLLSSAASAVEQLKVSTSRYSVFAPYLVNTNYSFNMSGNFTAFALLLDNGLPVSGTDITFDIYSNGSLKATLFSITQQNGLASVSYNTTGQFTARNDTDYGKWTITAYLTADTAVTDSTDMSILEGGYNTGINSTGATVSCAHAYCHKLTALTDANRGIGGNYPRSPYTGGYGNDSTFAEAAHLRSSHSSGGRGCYFCHPGYSANNTGYGYTNDVHKNRSCDFCHGDWTYIKANLTLGGGAGIPKTPSCYDCHPQFNSNPSAISTLADLLPGLDANVTGKNISVYSYNFDTKVPLTAHNGTDPSLIRSVPCVVCHGPAHNISKPDPAPENTNGITEASQCISCHGQKHFTGTSCTVCHSQNAHAIVKPSMSNCVDCHPSYVSSWTSSKHNKDLNANAPNCTECHTGYDTMHTGLIVNGTNTCIQCHEEGVNGFNFSHRNATSPDCTQCHFANSSARFDKNESLFAHDHNLTVEQNYYNYNKSGTIQMPLKSNGGVGVGMFPAWTCTQWCHGAGTSIKTSIDNASITWVNSRHAQSLVEAPIDQKNSCAKCKSPLNYNFSAPGTDLIPVEDWQGIQCRVCHDIHYPKYSNSTGGFPLAFYNGTASSQQGITVYDPVHNATELCEKCHSGSSHDSKFAGTHKDNGLDCASCHLNTTKPANGGFNNVSHSFEVMNAYNSSVKGCEVCHKPADHTFQYTANHLGKVTCEACHDKTVSRNATGYAANGNYGIYNDTATGLVSSYKGGALAPSTWPLHNITKNVSCDKCHGTKSAVTNLEIAPDFGDACLSCHSTVTSADLGLHSNFTGNPAVESIDCKTCHFGSFPMVKGAVNNSNTYFCADCHTTAGTAPNKSTTRIFTEKKHGQAACMDCHVADGIYHQDNPRGSVANLTYVNRYTSANIITTDCADCHYAANLDDGPFNAPGGGTHISSVGGSCTTGGGSSCHKGGTTLVVTMHSLSNKSQGNKPAVTIPTLSSSTVTRGSVVTVNATVSIASLYELVDGAQYRIMSGATEIQSWTSMSAVSGNFGGSSTSATAMINTGTLDAGTYNIEVRGMAGGPAQNTAIRYYPINGDISPTKSTPLTVVSPAGYINGTIYSGVDALEGALVSTTGASDTTKIDGTYSLSVPTGTYIVTASKQPTHNDNTTTVTVTASNTTYANMTLDEKLKGTITGSVTSG